MTTPYEEPQEEPVVESLGEEAVEERHGSAYLSAKDLRAIGIVLALLFLLMTPVYIVLKRQAQKAECAMNCKSIQGAMLLYMEVWTTSSRQPTPAARGERCCCSTANPSLGPRPSRST
jgi:hypothetical protein